MKRWTCARGRGQGWREFALARRTEEGAGVLEMALVLGWAWSARVLVGTRQLWPEEEQCETPKGRGHEGKEVWRWAR